MEFRIISNPVSGVNGEPFRASGTGATAYRPDVRPSRGGRKKSTL